MCKPIFEELNAINCNEFTEKKNDLTYLSWASAWEIVKKACPDASYRIIHFNGVPYYYDASLGYMVETEVTINGQTLMMWLPVMDSANKAQKDKAYTYKTRFGEKTVEAATMFDINTAIMRCLTKNLAMFGLGLYIYRGEDLPADEKIESQLQAEAQLQEAIANVKACENIDKLKEVYEKYPQFAKNKQFVDSINQKAKTFPPTAKPAAKPADKPASDKTEPAKPESK